MKVPSFEKFTQPGEGFSLYKNGGFTDFCRGPHSSRRRRVEGVS